MRLQFNCAVRNVTGSRHVIDANGHQTLLDCGLYQGPRHLAWEINQRFPFKPSAIRACILSHAHIDHCGALPSLVAGGFRGTIYATPPTIELAEIMLRDTANILAGDAEYLNRKRRRRIDQPIRPLYTEHDVNRALRHFKAVDYGERFDAAPGLTAEFRDAGHIIGSSVVDMEIRADGRTLRAGFTGDLGRKAMPILRDPAPLENLDVLITESTYGGREHPPEENLREELGRVIRAVQQRGGKLLIPAFSVGRTQVVLYFLRELLDRRAIPPIDVYVDSPLSVKATEVVAHHCDYYDAAARQLAGGCRRDLFQFDGLHYVRSQEDSIALNFLKGPAVIISASGMCEGGRILHHIRHTLHEPRNAILMVGWQAPDTLGRRILEKRPYVRVLDHEMPLRAEVHKMNGFSAHADGPALTDYAARALKPDGKAFLVHGEYEASLALQADLQRHGVNGAIIPEDHQWHAC